MLFFVASATGVLPGSPSSFESNDGDMVASSDGGVADWNSVTSLAAYTHVTDAAASNSDDSFTSGQKQDTTCPTTEGHKNPPKDDFTDVATYVETNTGTGDTYLYGATIRFTANGNASENVELNQGTAGTCTGSTLLARVGGDKLIAIDYVSPGAKCPFDASFSGPACFAVGTWIEDNSTTPCFVKTDTAPCWGDNFTALPPAIAEGAINDGLTVGSITHGGAITSGNNGISGVAVGLNQFAEFGVNLTDAGIIAAGKCETFAHTTFESRSSGSSFVSTTKDIAIVTKPISNCGRITIIKQTDPRGANQDFSFTSTIAGSELTCTRSTATSFTLNDNGNTGKTPGSTDPAQNSAGNTQDCTNVPSGTYTVTEGANPTGFVFVGIVCTSTDSGTGATTSGKTATITIVGSSTSRVICVYTNKLQLGALKITKKSSKSGNASLNGATFSVKDPDGTALPGSPFTVNGSLCIDGLTKLGTYTVTELTPPPGYTADPPTTQTATVSGNNAKCSDSVFAGTVFAFTDTPKTDLLIKVTSQDSGPGGSTSTITCTTGLPANFPGTDIGNSPQTGGPSAPVQVTANDLAPGDYTCKVHIDP
jgi:hypothetical protein